MPLKLGQATKGGTQGVRNPNFQIYDAILVTSEIFGKIS